MSKKRKVAWLSPLPPQRSGIANYSYWLVERLRTFLDIDLFSDGPEIAPELKKTFDVYPLAAYQQKHQNYDEAIYHLGNNSQFHKDIYKLAWNYPATIVLHDYNLSGFMHEAFYLQSDWKLYEEALSDSNREPERKGIQGFVPWLRRNAGTFPMSHPIVHKSKRVIVHHRWVRGQFTEASHIHVIPHFAKIGSQPNQQQIDSFKQRFHIRDSRFLIVCLGFINSNKLPRLQVETAKSLLANGYPVHWLFAGETAPEVKRLQSEVEAGEYREDITFTNYLDDVDYFVALLSADVIVNLRNPSMGEASGTLMHALAAAKPAIISNINQYKEFPDRVCWKVGHDENESRLLYEYLTVLLSNRDVREAISANSAEYAESVLSLDSIIPQWLKVLSISGGSKV